jgi:hypothetical protein
VGKKYKKKVRWDFKLACHGYGRDVKEALLDVCRSLEMQVEGDFGPGDLEKIEDHEVMGVDEQDEWEG